MKTTNRLKQGWSTLRFLLIVAIAMIPAAPLAASPPPTQGALLTAIEGSSGPNLPACLRCPIIKKPIGKPTWEPVDFHMFSAPIGTAATGYAEFSATEQSLLPPPKHIPHPDLGIGPGAPHAPPYDIEFARGVAANKYQDGAVFKRSEFSKGRGVWLVWMTVPAPGTIGSSPDVAVGPIIANALFPLHVHGIDLHNDTKYSVLADFDVPALDGKLNPPFQVDGHSHFPTFMADNADFGPTGVNLFGIYDYRITMVDRAGNGWRIDAYFFIP